MKRASAWSALLMLVMFAPLGAGLVDVPLEPTSEDPGVAPPEPQAAIEVGEPGPMQVISEPTAPVAPTTSGEPESFTAEDVLAKLEEILPEGDEPETLVNLRELVRMQQPNGTNETTIADEHGTVSHRHADVGEQGLSPVWATAFYGTPTRFLQMDVDGDGTEDTVVGSSIAVTALSGETGQPLWAHHIGSRVVSLFAVEATGSGPMEIGFATRWGGQNAQVAVLRASDGHEVWTYTGDYSFITAAPATEGLGDIVAVDIVGRHIRLAGADGSLIREDYPAIGLPVGFYESGAYDALAADVNGDGVTDTVSLHVPWLYVSAVVERVTRDQVLVYAVDGSTGETLWMAEAGGPPTETFSWMIPYGLTALETPDGADIAFSALSWTWVCEPSCRFYYGAHLRMIDGGSTGAGQIIGIRDTIQPDIQLELYMDVAGQDADGDGSEELVVLHASLVNGLVSGDEVAVERYAPLTRGGTMALISDISVGVAPNADFSDAVSMAGGKAIPIHWIEGLTGKAILLQPDGTASPAAAFAGAATTTAGHTGSQYVIGTTEEVVFRDAFDGADALAFPMRGTPYVLAAADHDGDRIDDMWVVSSDGNAYIIDGLTGGVLDTVDRDDIIVDLYLQDADDDRRADPYFMILKEGEHYGGIYYSYDAETVLFDLAENKTVWRADGFPYRDTWLDVTGDGVKDFVAEIDRDYEYGGGDWTTTMTIRVVDGVTGENAYSKSVVAPGFFWPDAIEPYTKGQKEGLAIVDRWEGLVITAPDGSKVKSTKFDDYWGGVCLGAADLDGDGDDSIFLALSDGDSAKQWFYSVGGNRSKAEVIPSMDIDDCDVVGVDNRQGGEDLLVMVTDYQGADDVRRVMLRHGADGEVWKQDGKQGTPGTGWFTFIGRDPRAPDGGRIFYGYQDHVYARSWDSGEIVGQFTVNGPFVINGAMIELDGRSPSEVVALTSDGLLWALAEDKEAVVAAVAKEAKEQGKELTTDVEDVQDIVDKVNAEKKSPGVALPLLIAALVVLVRRR